MNNAATEILRRRRVREVVYFHTDHFEPWRPIPGRYALAEGAISDVERFLAASASVDYARRLSLFYKANVNYAVSEDRELFRADPFDLLGFVPRDGTDRRVGQAFLDPIVNGSDHEVQVHIHHEYYTYNDTPRDPATFAYLATPVGRSFDNARLELGVRLSLEVLREDAGLNLDRWFFIHGHWALNASDPHECTVVREMEILQRNGCLGDFTQPAGRKHVDSRIETPYLVDPVAAPKGYDTAEARPTDAAGAGPSVAKRFFIWASRSTHEACSLDTFSPAVQRRLETPGLAALTHARTAPVIDGVLYVKTHCHSLHPNYWSLDARPTPLTDPEIRAELYGVFDAAGAAKAEVSFLTVSEVYDRIINARMRASPNLAGRYKLADASPMNRIGATVAFSSSDGRPKSPPALAPRPKELPSALPARFRRGRDDVADPIVPHVISLADTNAPATTSWSSRRDESLFDRCFRRAPRLPPPVRLWAARKAARRGMGAQAIRAAASDPEVLCRAGLYERAIESAADRPSDRFVRACATAALGDIETARSLFAICGAISREQRRFLAARAAPFDPVWAEELLPPRDWATRAACALAAENLAITEAHLASAPAGQEARFLAGAVAGWRGQWRGARIALNAAFRADGLAPPLDEKCAAPTVLAAFSEARASVLCDGPLISVVMAVRDGAPTLVLAATSILAQTWRNIELLIVDDGSVDQTARLAADIAKRDSRVRVLANRCSPGASGARNTGLESARGAFVALHDADDWAHPQRLERQMSALGSRAAATLCRHIRLDLEGRLVCPRVFPFVRMSPITLLVRTEALALAGPFEAAPVGADSELVARLDDRFGRRSTPRISEVGIVALWAAGSLSASPGTGLTGDGLRQRLSYVNDWRLRHAQITPLATDFATVDDRG